LFTILGWIGMPQLVPNQFVLKGSPSASQISNGDANTGQKVPIDQHLVASRVLITYVEPGSPADKAGLKAEDQINDIALPGYSPVGVSSADKLPQITKQFAGKTADVYYTREGHEQRARITFLTKQDVAASQKTNNPKGYLGISPTDYTVQRYTWSAPIVAVGFAVQVTALTFQGLAHAIGGLGSLIAGFVTGNHAARVNGASNASSQVAGPVGIFVILKNGSLLGYQFMLLIIAIISLTLAIMNILPIPALDGGRLWTILLSRALKHPLSAGQEEALNAVGFVILLGLIIVITTVDIHRFL
jgi:regulator of sigma E protease